MQIVQDLPGLRSWCLAAIEGQEEEFFVAREVVQDEASRFAGDVNMERDGHVWINVLEMADSPEATTRIHVRCTN